ncbi:hypothetical protein [Reyranella sp.]|jgi:hypothetical protein|uniref:hypothetical protein n=1 Tax=Reyranella sp. TaxID=1929291 RepID=UPI0040352A8C
MSETTTLRIGTTVRHARRNAVGTIQNISYPLLPGRPAKYDVRFPNNPTAPCWCFADDLTPTAIPQPRMVWPPERAGQPVDMTPVVA